MQISPFPEKGRVLASLGHQRPKGPLPMIKHGAPYGSHCKAFNITIVQRQMSQQLV
jgi:hypothetical protein